MRILIAVPTFETIAPETFRSIYALETDHHTDFDFVKGYDCAKARNEMARKAIDGGYDYILMVDSDIIVPPDALSKMLEIPTDVCLGCYPVKNTPGLVELCKGDSTENLNEHRYRFSELPDTPRISVIAGGMGCALIKTDVFREEDYPWFRFRTWKSGNFLSEDFYFCIWVRNVGRKVEADTRVRCGHLTRGFIYE